MIWTVKELIKELKQWPGDWNVATAFDDNLGDEIQWCFTHAHELDDGEAKKTHGPTVILRP